MACLCEAKGIAGEEQPDAREGTGRARWDGGWVRSTGEAG